MTAHEIAERICTGLRLPDGDLLDVWVIREADGTPCAVSDLGETLRWRRNVGRPPLTAAQIAALAAAHGVAIDRGVIRAAIVGGEIADAIDRATAAALPADLGAGPDRRRDQQENRGPAQSHDRACAARHSATRRLTASM
jgi:hypothetical protein